MIYLFLVVIFFSMLLLFYMYKQAHLNIVNKHEFSFSKDRLDKPLRLFFISDIHRRSIHPSIISKVYDQVDLVIIGGDLLEGGVPLHRIDQNIQKLSTLGPIYFIWGNNDGEINQSSLFTIFQKWGVHVVKNASVILNHGQKEWTLIGVDDMNTGNADIDFSIQGVKETSFKVLVSHDPRVMRIIQERHRITLVLSGHTHGGQIRIMGFGPYEKGKTYTSNKITHIISNGYGTTALPLRLGVKPETHHIIIQSI